MTWCNDLDGPIQIPVLDSSGQPTSEIRPGYRINTTPALCADRPELAAFRVTPHRLARVWAGDDPEAPAVTIALLFADEAEARVYLGDFWREPDPE